MTDINFSRWTAKRKAALCDAVIRQSVSTHAPILDRAVEFSKSELEAMVKLYMAHGIEGLRVTRRVV